ncbi:aldehyde dehydrogenase family protein [Terriglobus roseus]|uniref:Aldehyde dehydrogenase n=1 Tax=Terriglobus roseus TaxID=392734 RepID=A0A1G7NQP9_9BACT|nr:aldehyde dehydrogenase family protein [Terriglobus roseus]SDF75600.1 Acyl-CoA reductase [Terriglobus roseus]
MDTNQIIEIGRAAGRQWSQQTSMARRRVLSRLASVLAARQDDLVSAIVQDVGKPSLDALSGDVLVTLEQMRYYHRHAHKVLMPRRVAGDWLLFHGSHFIETFEPHGVVLIYGPANYPLQLSMIPAITAMYAGNAVVLKMSEQTPKLAEILKKIVIEAALPANLVQIVCDSPATAESYIDARPDFICFTGSSVNGARVAERAARFLIPTLMELGGKDAAIVFSDCNLERTIEGVVYGAFLNSGQVCVGIKRLFIEEAIYTDFMVRFKQRIWGLSISAGNEDPHDLSPVSSKSLLQRLQVQIADALQRGAQVATDPADLSGETPLVLIEVPRDAALLSEESFGPVLCVSRFHSEEDAIHLADDSIFALGASVWTSDPARATRVASQMHAANIAINDVIRNIANPAVSFGGNQSSGYGRYHGPAGLRTFSRTKTVMYGRSKATRERNWFPFTAKEYDLLRKLIRFRFQTFAKLSGFLGSVLNIVRSR